MANLAPLIVINLAFGFLFPGIDNAAHIGGLLAGLWLGYLFIPEHVPTLARMWQGRGSTTGRATGILRGRGVAALVAVLVIWGALSGLLHAIVLNGCRALGRSMAPAFAGSLVMLVVLVAMLGLILMTLLVAVEVAISALLAVVIARLYQSAWAPAELDLPLRGEGEEWLRTHEEIFQDVFLRVLESLPRFEGRSKLSTWIASITVHACYKFIHKAGRRERVESFRDSLDGEPEPGVPSDLQENLERTDVQRRLEQHLGGLAPKYALPLVLFYLEGMSYQEIAEILEVPLGTVKSHLFRGLRELRKRI